MCTQQSTSGDNVHWRHLLLTSAPSQELIQYPAVKRVNNGFNNMIKTNVGSQYGNCLVQFLSKLDSAKEDENISVIRGCFQILVIFSIFKNDVGWLTSNPYKAITTLVTHITSTNGDLGTQVNGVNRDFRGY
ncbi:MAG: hypothetical protein Q9188_007668 [Gyalolechia gomerana]